MNDPNGHSLRLAAPFARFLFAVILYFIATNCFGQDTLTTKQGKYVFVAGSGTVTPPPDSLPPCQTCPPGEKGDKGDNGRGIVSTVVDPTTGIMTVTYTDGTKYISSSLTGPPGQPGLPGSPGVCPSCPPSGGGTAAGWTSNKIFDVTTYGANPNDNVSDLAAFQAASDAARAVAGKVIIPSPGSGTYYLNGTWNIIPDASNQCWLDIEMMGGAAGKIRYNGPSNQPVIKIIGLKGAIFTGLNIAIESGRSNVQIFDILTTQSANSSSFVTFKQFYLNLGDGQNNIGIRTGYQSPGDISNYNFENMIVFGGGSSNGSQTLAIPGQYAFENLGVNTLSMAWFGGFVAYCDRAYTNISADGQSRGNGASFFNDLGCSQNNEDFVFSFEQIYKISGGRFEAGNRFLRVTANGAYSHSTVEAVTVHDYRGVNGNLIQIDGQGAVTIKNSMFAKTDGSKYSSPVTIGANGKFGALSVKQCSFTSDVIYTKPGNSTFDVELRGNVKLGYGFQSIGTFGNQ